MDVKYSIFSQVKGRKDVIIVGNGGIGSAMADYVNGYNLVDRVFVLSRKRPPIKRSTSSFIYIPVNFLDEVSVCNAYQQLSEFKARPFLLFIATGILHNKNIHPEKSIRLFDPNATSEVFNINTIGPMMVIHHFLPLFSRGQPAIISALSARVGSIGDNRLGGWYSYRASKAALNMIVKCLAIELARTHKHLAAVSLHPGTVDTNLSRPFQSGVTEDKLFSPTQSAGYLFRVLSKVRTQDSGKCFAWDGSEVPA